ncbi:MAG: FG-GAP repeat protein [bacterium]|nr:MAG: FG-GAP repeat protein [bacterium]
MKKQSLFMSKATLMLECFAILFIMPIFASLAIAQTANFFNAAERGDEFGVPVGNADDVNRDSYNNLIGEAWPNDGGRIKPGEVFIDSIFTGEMSFNYFGWSVAGAGDVNGDGYNDIIIGARGNSAAGDYAGRAYIYLGGAKMDNIADVIFTGIKAGDELGTKVAGAGDINGDGYDDVIIKGDYRLKHVGQIYVYFGGSEMDNIVDVVLTGEAMGDKFGDIASAGDVNCDGYSDIIVAGVLADRAYVYLGGARMDNVVDVTFTGITASWPWLATVAGAGDVNGDGFDDVIVGAMLAAEAYGQAYIYLGGTSMDNVADVTLAGTVANELFGGSVSSAGDMNGDGYDDVIVGTYQQYFYPKGSAYLFLGGVSMDSVADVKFIAPSEIPFFGTPSVLGGDVNGDGYSDVIVSGWYYGPVKVYFGGNIIDDVADGNLAEFQTDFRKDYSVAGAGDMNGDGYTEIILGEPNDDTNGEAAGKAHLYFLASSPPPTTPRITSVLDVPHDQGGNVIIKWNGSCHDVSGKIIDYLIQCSLPRQNSDFFWETIDSLVATQDLSYSSIVKTLYDSSANTNGIFYFHVIARTENRHIQYKSLPVAGYSVANLLLPPVQFLSAEVFSGLTVKLKWNQINSASNVQYYIIFRSITGDFSPSPDLQIGTTVDSVFIDPAPIPGVVNYYRIITVDIYGNKSAPSLQVSIKVEDIPTQYTLFQNYPNPVTSRAKSYMDSEQNFATTIQFELPEYSAVTLKVYDISGREVTTLVDGISPPGVHKVLFDVGNLTSGVYFYQLKAGRFIRQKKMLVTK